MYNTFVRVQRREAAHAEHRHNLSQHKNRAHRLIFLVFAESKANKVSKRQREASQGRYVKNWRRNKETESSNGDGDAEAKRKKGPRRQVHPDCF